VDTLRVLLETGTVHWANPVPSHILFRWLVSKGPETTSGVIWGKLLRVAKI